jgi:hypothetical protein
VACGSCREAGSVPRRKTAVATREV